MDYKYAYTFNSKEIIDKFIHAYSVYNNCINNSEQTNQKDNSTRWKIDFNNPRHSLHIGNLKVISEFSKYETSSKYTIDSKDSTRVINTATSPAGEKELIVVNSWKRALNYLEKSYLRKNNSVFSVNWNYNIPISEDNIANSLVPSYGFSSFMFLKLRNGQCRNLKVKSSVRTHDICNTGTMKRIANSKESRIIEASASSIKSLNLSFSNEYIESKNITFSNIESDSSKIEFLEEENSLLSDELLHKKLYSNKLISEKEFFVESRENFSDKSSTEVVTLSEIESISNKILVNIDSEITRDFGTIKADSSDAVSIKMCHNYISAKVADFFTSSLDSFIKIGTSDSSLVSAYSHIDKLIKILTSQYIKLDECDTSPPNNINEGCVVSCDKTILDEEKLMVSKQKLKSVVFCSLKC